MNLHINQVHYLNTYIALYFRTPKLPVIHTHNPKKIVSIPLTLVPSLANYPLPYTPLHWESRLHTPTPVIPVFGATVRASLCVAVLTFVRLPLDMVSKLLVFIMPLLLDIFSD